MSSNEQSTNGPTVGVKLIKNSKGYTWEIKAYDWPTVDEAIARAKEADIKLRAEFGQEGQAL